MVVKTLPLCLGTTPVLEDHRDQDWLHANQMPNMHYFSNLSSAFFEVYYEAEEGSGYLILMKNKEYLGQCSMLVRVQSAHIWEQVWEQPWSTSWIFLQFLGFLQFLHCPDILCFRSAIFALLWSCLFSLERLYSNTGCPEH